MTDTRLLATAAQLRSQWADLARTYYYPINGADQQRGIGPMLGRYPGDVYDGDTDAQAATTRGRCHHANFAELYYRLAERDHRLRIRSRAMPTRPRSSPRSGSRVEHAGRRRSRAAAAGDQMLQAIVFHSDHLELSEQFDATSGYREEREQPVLELRRVPLGATREALTPLPTARKVFVA